MESDPELIKTKTKDDEIKQLKHKPGKTIMENFSNHLKWTLNIEKKYERLIEKK